MKAQPVLHRAVRPVETVLLSFVAEGPVAEVAQKNVVPPLAEEEIDISVVVEVAGADTLAPAEMPDARLLRHILKAKVAEVVIEERRQAAGRTGLQPVGVHDEDVEQAVVVVVEEGDARAGVLDDVGLVLFAGNHDSGESGARRATSWKSTGGAFFPGGRARAGWSVAPEETICE